MKAIIYTRVSKNDQKLLSAHERLAQNIIASLAEYESDMRSERIKLGLRSKKDKNI